MSTLPESRYRVRFASGGSVRELGEADLREAIRKGEVTRNDRVSVNGGPLVRWTHLEAFSDLARRGGLTGSAAPSPSHAIPPVARARASDERPLQREPETVPAPPEPAVDDAERAAKVDDVLWRLRASGAFPSMPPPRPTTGSGLIRLPDGARPHPEPARSPAPGGDSTGAGTPRPPEAGARGRVVDPLTDELLGSGPRAVLEEMVTWTIQSILGVLDDALPRQLEEAHDRRVAQFDGAWRHGSLTLRSPSAQAARLDLNRLVAAALRVLKTPEERALYEQKKARIGRAPRLLEVTDFELSEANDRDRARVSSADEEVLRALGFDLKTTDEKPARPARGAKRPEVARSLDPRNPNAAADAEIAKWLVGADGSTAAELETEPAAPQQARSTRPAAGPASETTAAPARRPILQPAAHPPSRQPFYVVVWFLTVIFAAFAFLRDCDFGAPDPMAGIDEGNEGSG